MLYEFGAGRDIDVGLWRFDQVATYETGEPLAYGVSTNDHEQLTAQADATGWYYLEIRGKAMNDINVYVVSYTLNPPSF